MTSLAVVVSGFPSRSTCKPANHTASMVLTSVVRRRLAACWALLASVITMRASTTMLAG